MNMEINDAIYLAYLRPTQPSMFSTPNYQRDIDGMKHITTNKYSITISYNPVGSPHPLDPSFSLIEEGTKNYLKFHR